MAHTNPIDFVLTWVDGNDPRWRKVKDQYISQSTEESNKEVRFRDWDNLQFWFRGVEKYTPWLNKIHFVTWGHLPSWLNTHHPKINIVNHRDYIPEQYLPTFNSHTIELNLHRIKGIAEQFVYFNDDTFVNQPMQPSDFFYNGLPCDTFALDCIFFGKDSAGSYNGNDMTVINSHIDKKQALKQNLRKWFQLRYGYRLLYRTTALAPWHWFPGFYYQHLPNSFLKTTFDELWGIETDVLDATCQCKFRSPLNVNQWLMKYWQLATGKFSPRSPRIGRCYHVKDTNFEQLLQSITTGEERLLCINDTAETTNFEDKKQRVIDAFKTKLPYKSTYEL